MKGTARIQFHKYDIIEFIAQWKPCVVWKVGQVRAAGNHWGHVVYKVRDEHGMDRRVEPEGIRAASERTIAALAQQKTPVRFR